MAKKGRLGHSLTSRALLWLTIYHVIVGESIEPGDEIDRAEATSGL
jgi:hypothetical protein